MHIFSGIYKNRSLKAPKGWTTRPTSGRLREAVFNIVQHYIEDAEFLDLFAGSGAVGIEALSRGAQSAVFVDHHKDAIKCIKSNLEQLDIDIKGKVIYGDVFLVLKKLDKEGKQFDIIYVDPPYEQEKTTVEGSIPYSQLVLDQIDQSQLLREGGSLFIEEAASTTLVNEHLKSLVAQRERTFGRSSLHHFERG